MVHVKRRKKTSRLRGSRTAGWGFRKKHRGSGHRGGVGMAGTGKRASQKKQFGLMHANKHGVEEYFGRRGFTSISTAKPKREVINLLDIQKRFGDQKEIKLEDHKILGDGEGFKATIHAKSASQSAIEKMEKAGGKIIVQESQEKPEVKPVKAEKKVEVKKK
jgi:large subunit ribosomal protein L15